MAKRIDRLISEYNRVKNKRDGYIEALDELRCKLADLMMHEDDDRVTLVRVKATTVKAHKRHGFSYIRV